MSGLSRLRCCFSDHCSCQARSEASSTSPEGEHWTSEAQRNMSSPLRCLEERVHEQGRPLLGSVVAGFACNDEQARPLLVLLLVPPEPYQAQFADRTRQTAQPDRRVPAAQAEPPLDLDRARPPSHNPDKESGGRVRECR